MGTSSVGTRLAQFGETQRRDPWWVEILPVVILLGGFGLYATLRAFEGKFYEWGPYLSPFYSPLIDAGHSWWKFSPALLILASLAFGSRAQADDNRGLSRGGDPKQVSISGLSFWYGVKQA